LRFRADFYASGHPTREDVLLVVEVADTSVDFYRQTKVPLYARGGIRETWLVDLNQDTVTTYREPTADGYRLAQVVRRGESLAPVAFPERGLTLAEILG
jgi:Uma2 family endonuclease